MKTYMQLTTVDRGAPCLEYPGTWYGYLNGREVAVLSGKGAEDMAFTLAREKHIPYENCVEVGWLADDNDPRVGEIWFTSYYTALTLGDKAHKYAD